MSESQSSIDDIIADESDPVNDIDDITKDIVGELSVLQIILICVGIISLLLTCLYAKYHRSSSDYRKSLAIQQQLLHKLHGYSGSKKRLSISSGRSRSREIGCSSCHDVQYEHGKTARTSVTESVLNQSPGQSSISAVLVPLHHPPPPTPQSPQSRGYKNPNASGIPEVMAVYSGSVESRRRSVGLSSRPAKTCNAALARKSSERRDAGTSPRVAETAPQVDQKSSGILEDGMPIVGGPQSGGLLIRQIDKLVGDMKLVPKAARGKGRHRKRAEKQEEGGEGKPARELNKEELEANEFWNVLKTSIQKQVDDMDSLAN